MHMRFDINLESREKQRIFLHYLNSKLRDLSQALSGSAGFNDDGSFESSVIGQFAVGEKHIGLVWKIYKTPDGRLPYIDVELANESEDVPDWQGDVSSIIISVLASAFSEKKEKFFRRVLLCYVGHQLDGEYWLPGLRFAPVWPDDDSPWLHNAQRYLCIDADVDAIDVHDAISIANELARRYAARLSLLLDIGLHVPQNDLLWGYPMPFVGQLEKATRFQSGFFGYGQQIDKMPKKGSICPLGKYTGSLSSKGVVIGGDLLSLPPEARKILRAVDGAPPQISDAFDNGARLCQVAAVVGRQFPSVGLAYRVAAVEAISQCDKSCNGFSQFVRKYAVSSPETDSLLNYMHGTVRSGHFHAGKFPLGEFDRKRFFEPFIDGDDVWSARIHRECRRISRLAIVNWMVGLLPEVPKSA